MLDEVVDLDTLITARTAFDEVVQFLAFEATLWRRKLNWPQEVGSFLEVWADSEDFVDDIFNAFESLFAQTSLDDGVGGKWDSLAVDLAKATLVDDFANRLQVRITVSNEWFNQSKHLDGGSVDTNEDTVVELAQAKKLQDLLNLRGDTDDTTDSDDEDKLLFRSDEDFTLSLGSSAVVNGDLGDLKLRNKRESKLVTMKYIELKE